MADKPVEVKKAPQTAAPVPEIWSSFRSEIDRLFDRFARGFGLPSLRSIADFEPPSAESGGGDRRFQPSRQPTLRLASEPSSYPDKSGPMSAIACPVRSVCT